MNSLRRLAESILVAAVLCFSEGCASHTDLIAQGRVTLEARFDTLLRQPPRVSEDEGNLVVDGRLNRSPRDLGWYVDVSVIAPDGATIYDTRVNYRAGVVAKSGTPTPRRGSFRSVPTRHGSHGVYSVTFPGLPPDGSVVRVSLHAPDTVSALMEMAP